MAPNQAHVTSVKKSASSHRFHSQERFGVLEAYRAVVPILLLLLFSTFGPAAIFAAFGAVWTHCVRPGKRPSYYFREGLREIFNSAPGDYKECMEWIEQELKYHSEVDPSHVNKPSHGPNWPHRLPVTNLLLRELEGKSPEISLQSAVLADNLYQDFLKRLSQIVVDDGKEVPSEEALKSFAAGICVQANVDAEQVFGNLEP